MIDVNWDLAPEGAEMIIQYNDTLVWAKEGYYWHIHNDKWEIDDCEDENIVLSTRPKPKTVADAAEYFEGVWPEEKDAVCVWDDKRKNFEFWISDYEPVTYCYEVCNYEQFEAYVKEREASTAIAECAEKSEGILKALAEQEGEKWTHTYNGDVCKIVHQVDNDVWIKFKFLLGSMVVPVESLKPIKPTISESEAWRKAVLAVNMRLITDNYNVVAKD